MPAFETRSPAFSASAVNSSRVRFLPPTSTIISSSGEAAGRPVTPARTMIPFHAVHHVQVETRGKGIEKALGHGGHAFMLDGALDRTRQVHQKSAQVRMLAQDRR